MDKTLAVIIPAYNERATIGQIVQSVRAVSSGPVIVVDDNSSDDTIEIARNNGATVLSLPLRLGAWGATQAGIRYALKQDIENVITMDADGQHDAKHIPSLLTPLLNTNADVIIGAFPERISRARSIACNYFRLLTGLKLADITSGFRAYNHHAMKILASSEASLLDYQDVGLLLILRRHGMRLQEVLTPMVPRLNGHSRIFSSWLIVANYMLQTSLLCLARVGR